MTLNVKMYNRDFKNMRKLIVGQILQLAQIRAFRDDFNSCQEKLIINILNFYFSGSLRELLRKIIINYYVTRNELYNNFCHFEFYFAGYSR